MWFENALCSQTDLFESQFYIFFLGDLGESLKALFFSQVNEDNLVPTPQELCKDWNDNKQNIERQACHLAYVEWTAPKFMIETISIIFPLHS